MFIIFDTETTGLPKRDNAPLNEVDNWPRVVQIAWQVHDGSGELLEHHNVLIRPDGYEIPYSAEKVHGISTEKATSQGIPVDEALLLFNESLAGSQILVGHNIRFDINAERRNTNKNIDGMKKMLERQKLSAGSAAK